jgi:hypothetical protein
VEGARLPHSKVTIHFLRAALTSGCVDPVVTGNEQEERFDLRLRTQHPVNQLPILTERMRESGGRKNAGRGQNPGRLRSIPGVAVFEPENRICTRGSAKWWKTVAFPLATAARKAPVNQAGFEPPDDPAFFFGARGCKPGSDEGAVVANPVAGVSSASAISADLRGGGHIRAFEAADSKLTL